MSEPTGDDLVRPIIEAILSGEAHWLSAAPLFYEDDAEDERLVNAVRSLENDAWQREQMTDPTALNYPWCKGEWTADMDAAVVASVRAIMAGEE